MDTGGIKRLLNFGPLVLLLLHDLILVSCEDPIVKTDKGYVRGFTKYPNGKKLDVFYGIPFARPPIHDLQFKPPVQLDPWSDVFNATTLPNSCCQEFDFVFGNFSGSTMWNANTRTSEDCLYLNVWVPRTNPPYQDKAVLVWIYGGGFYSGTSTLDIYMADYLAAENDIIVVSMQYRVGPLGFLTLDPSEAPGNMGLMDQRMALEWVSRNIHFFGGSAHKVTLMGESAGAVSVGLFLLCDLCRGYFQRAILQSGAPQAKWGTVSKAEMINRSVKFTQLIGCYKENDPAYTVKCLGTKDPNSFPEYAVRVSAGFAQFPFVPHVDGVFIRQDPQKMLDNHIFKKVPILLGSNSNEATFFMIYWNDNFKRNKDSPITMKRYHDVIAEPFFQYYPHFPHILNAFGHQAISFIYTNWLNSHDGYSLTSSLDKALSDFNFVCPVNQLARAYARQNMDVFYYWFDHRWSANPWAKWMGVLHADEIWFTFGHPLNHSLPFTVEERDLSIKMMQYWTNFAKTGDPNKSPGEASLGEWPRFKVNEELYLNLSARTLLSGEMVFQGPRSQQCAFWDHYLPRLVSETCAIEANISEVEKEWKLAFYEWKTRYIVDWKAQFENFLNDYRQRMGTCSGRRP